MLKNNKERMGDIMHLNNLCRITGILVNTPELNTTSAGVSRIFFTLAVKRERPDASGQWGVDFPQFVAWRRKAEKIASSYKKGDLIEVIGRLQTRTSLDKHGIRHHNTEIIVSESRKVPSFNASDASSLVDPA